jgi:hypothetical protein
MKETKTRCLQLLPRCRPLEIHSEVARHEISENFQSKSTEETKPVSYILGYKFQ